MAQSADVTAGVNAVASDHNALRADVVLGLAVTGTETDGATITFDLSDKTKGKVRTVTLGGNRILAISNGTVGQVFVVRLVQGAGGQTVTWFSTIKWPGNVIPTLSTGAGKTDTFVFLITGSNTYDGTTFGQNF